MEQVAVQDKKITVDVIIPVYNEEQFLKQAVEKLSKFLSMQDFEWRIVIVSNGSIDRTKEVGENLARTHPRIRFFHILKRGRGWALRKAFSESRALVCVYTDVDLAVDINVLSELVKYAIEHNAIAMPNRLDPGIHTKRPSYRILLSKIYNLLIKILFPGTVIKDAQVGMKAIPRSISEVFLKRVKNNNFFFDTELLLLTERAGHPIIQIPAQCYDMRYRKVNLILYILEQFLGLIRMKIRLLIPF